MIKLRFVGAPAVAGALFDFLFSACRGARHGVRPSLARCREDKGFVAAAEFIPTRLGRRQFSLT